VFNLFYKCLIYSRRRPLAQGHRIHLAIYVGKMAGQKTLKLRGEPSHTGKKNVSRPPNLIVMLDNWWDRCFCWCNFRWKHIRQFSPANDFTLPPPPECRAMDGKKSVRGCT